MANRLRKHLALAFFAFLISSGAPTSLALAQSDVQVTSRDAHRAEDHLARYTLWLAIFTGALVVVSGLQIFFLIRADKTARTSADAARTAAEATKASVRQMADTAQRELRAYVNINGARILDSLDRTKRRAAVEIKNFGKTPAHNQTMWVSTVVREYPLNSILESPPDDLRVGRETLPPGRSSVVEIPIGPLNDWEENQLRSGKAAIYITGEIQYTDIFSSARTTNYRLLCAGEGLVPGRVAADAEGNVAT